MPVPRRLAALVDLDPETEWSMRPAERLAIVGLLETLRPERTLGLGRGARECIEWLGRYSGQVVCVDVDPELLALSSRAGNVRLLHAKSEEAMIGFATREEHFDFALVTGAESTAVARDDLLGAAALADVVVLHGTAVAQCRDGYLEALRQMNVHAQLDLVDGYLGEGGPQGGLGLVLTDVTRELPRHSAPQRPTTEILRHEQRVISNRRYRVQHALRLLTNIGARELELFPLQNADVRALLQGAGRPEL